MKAFLPFLFAFLSFISFYTSAQNLVQNSDFELFSKMPSGTHNGIDCAKYWRTPTFASNDYYHVDADELAGTSKNRFGKQTPHSGKAYGGICIREEYVEYLAINLLDTLIKDQDYLVEFYISKAEKSKGSVNEFGILFTDRIKWSITQTGISEKPSVDFTNKNGYTDTKEWIKLSAIYHAKGFETTLILGHFIYDKQKGPKKSCHYYMR